MTVKRRKYGTGHAYYVDEVKVPGVTTIIGDTTPKDGLTDWAARSAADYAIDNWDELLAMRPSERHKALHFAYRQDRDKAGRRGTEVHRLAERLVAFEEVAKPEELAGHIDSYVSFLDAMNPEPIAVELVVVNRTLRYCGTADLVCDLGEVLAEEVIPPGRWLLDLKTARSGIFGETALQVCGYARAEAYLDPETGEERPMDALKIEHCGAVHITADGWELRPLDTGEATWEHFRHLRWIYDRLPEMRATVGPAVALPVPA
jgi:hypothetical protein